MHVFISLDSPPCGGKDKRGNNQVFKTILIVRNMLYGIGQRTDWVIFVCLLK